MKLPLIVNGREAIPVRAIPIITNWRVRPEVLVSVLAQRPPPRVDHRYNLIWESLPGLPATELYAYRMEDGILVKLQPKHWDECHESMAVMIHEPGIDLQRYKKVAMDVLLGTDAFVCRDEFETAYIKALGTGPFPKVYRPGDRDIDWPSVKRAGAGTAATGFGTDAAPSVAEQAVSPATSSQAIKGITKEQVKNAFEGLHFDREHWGRNLATPTIWLMECRVAAGSKKASALWNPVLIAAALVDKGISLKKLDAVFVGLRDWVDEWTEVSAGFR